MPERRPSNSELRLRRLTSGKDEDEQRGILELFDDAVEEPADEDAPLSREADERES